MFKKIIKSYLFLSLFIFLMAGFSNTSSAELLGEEEPDQYVQVRLIADKTTVNGGEIVRIGVEQTIYPNWHVYWKNPGDSGTPPSIEWQLPPDFTVSELEFPTGKKIPYGPLTNYGYEGQVTFLQNLTLPINIGTTPFALNAKVNLLVCHDICIPETHEVWIKFNADTIAEPEKIRAAEATLPTVKNWPATYQEIGNNFVIKTSTQDTTDLQNATNITLLPEEWGAVDNNADATIKITADGFELSQKIGERDLNEISSFPYVITYTNAQGENKSIRLQAQPKLIAATAAPSQSSLNIFQALLFALLGGVILNLMPCVFPVLSMKALSLINLKGKEETKARGYGIAYTLGILLSFAAIGGALLLLKAGGAQIGWGFQLQNPVVITLLAYLVFVIGLNLSGFFEFNTGRLGNLGQGLTQRDDNRGAFFTGVLATLVATPCTAPFMGAAMGFALTQPALISMLVFLALGLGLALPYLALCFIPALRSKLPRPGHWMETFRNFLAFPMFITAAWLVWVLSQQISAIGVFVTLIGAVLIAFSLWLMQVMPPNGLMRNVAKILLILSIAFALISPFLTHEATKNPLEKQIGQNWEEFTPEKLSTLLTGDAPVFTNMTASWCITCKVNERVALKNGSVEELFAEKNIQYLKGDWTNQNPDITQYLNSFGRNGVPLYVYYPPRNPQTGARPDAIVLPQILTAGLVEKTIQ